MSRKINVLYFIPTFGPGGTEKIVLNLCNLLNTEIFNTNVSVFQSGEFEKELKKGQRVFALVNVNGSTKHILKKGLNFVNRIKRLNQILKEESVDILHTHHLGPFLHALLVSRRRKGIRWIHTEHIRPDIDKSYPRNGVRVINRFSKFADAVTGVSEEVGTYFHNKARVPEDKIFTILNGVDIKKYSCPNGRFTKRSEIGIPEDTLVIGIIGSLRKQKNHKNLIKAFSIVLSLLSNVCLVIVGDGECREDAEGLVSDLNIVNYVHFLGYRLDTAELMSAIDVYCLPSFFEGMPLTVIEAWAAGKPVVATNVIGVKELVRHEENGVLVPSDNPEKLAEELIRVITDVELRDKIARNGHNFAIENCTVEHMVKQYEDLYLMLMNRNL